MSEPYHLVKGRVIGRNYKVLQFLGSGWEGEVYKVEECDTGIIRAAKLFYTRPEERLSPHVHYAQKLYRLRHCPIVIQYHSYDKTIIKKEPVDFLISDFVDGEVLSTFLKKQPQKRLSYFEALHLFYALIQGVEHIHILGEYHGDIHLENIMVKRHGLGFDVKLIDFIHLGRNTKTKIHTDVIDLMHILYALIGGKKGYAQCPKNFKHLICGRKRQLITSRFPAAGYVRLCLENLSW
jgi:serine/threonine protein kinase